MGNPLPVALAVAGYGRFGYHNGQSAASWKGTRMEFWVVVAALALAQTAIVVTALRMKVEPDPARGIVGARMTEVLWTLLPVVLIVAVVVLSLAERG